MIIFVKYVVYFNNYTIYLSKMYQVRLSLKFSYFQPNLPVPGFLN